MDQYDLCNQTVWPADITTNPYICKYTPLSPNGVVPQRNEVTYQGSSDSLQTE